MRRQPRSVKWPWLCAVVALTLVGGWIRLDAAAGTGLWLDEIMAIHRSQRDPFGTSWNSLVDGQHGPLHHALLALSDRVSQSEVSYRLPTVLAGTATIPVVFAIGATACSPAAGLLAATLLAVSPLHTYCSAEARPAVLLLLAFAVGLLSVMTLVRLPGLPRARLTLLLVVAVLLLTSGQGLWYSASLLLVAAVPTLWHAQRRVAGLVWLAGGAALAAALFFAVYGGFVQRGTDAASTPPLTPDLIGRLFQPLVSGYSETQAVSQALVWSAAVTVMLGAAFLFVRRRAQAGSLLALAAAGGLFLPLIPLFAFGWGIREKYVMAALAPVLVLHGVAVATVIEMLADRLRSRRTWIRPLVVTVLIATTISIAAWVQRGPMRTALGSRADWRGVAQSIKETARPGQTILASNDWPVQCLGWYLPRMGVHNQVESAGESIERAVRRLEGQPDAILVAGGFHANDAIRRWMEQFHPIYAAHAEAIRVYYYPDRAAHVLRGLPTATVTRDERRLWDGLHGEIGIGETNEPFLLEGWEGVERDRAGTPFRWVLGRTCTLYVPLQRHQVASASIRVRPFDPLVGRVSMTISVNHEEVTTRHLQAGWNTLDVTLGDARWQYGGNLLELRFSAAARPSDSNPGSPDTRLLSAAVGAIRLRDIRQSSVDSQGSR